MLLRTIVCLLLISFVCEGFPQKFIDFETYNVDSLRSILPGQHAEERVNTLNSLAASIFFEEIDLGKQYAEKAMNLAKELDYQEGVADAFFNFGRINYYLGNYPVALNNLYESIRIYEKLNKKTTVAWMYYKIATIHLVARNYKKTIEYCNISLDKFREPLEGGDTVGSARDIATVLGGLSYFYAALGKFEKSIEIRLKFLELGKRNNFGITEMMFSTFITGVYFYQSGKIDSAKVYFYKALAYPDTNPNIEALKYRSISWLGNVCYAAGDIDSAIFYKQKTFKWFIEKGILYWAMEASNDLGRITYENSEVDIAENYFLQTERIFNEMIKKNSLYRHDSLKNIVTHGVELYFPMSHRLWNEMKWTLAKSMYYKLYQINEEKKRKGKALKYYISYDEAKDTLNKLQQNREIIELQTKFESERKDQQIENLSKENEFKDIRISQSRIILFGLVGLVILIVILAIVLIRQNKLREQQKNLLLQQKLFRSQMNPHFIFNSLARIQNFIVKQDSKKASIYFSRFSELLRNILDNSSREFIPFEKELGTIENYLDLQKIRYVDKFDYKIDVDEAIDTESIQIPPMLAQPFIENAIEHGIKHKDSKGHIQIRFSLQDNLIVFEVEDDGVGREKAREILYTQNKDHQSMATIITRERIQMLNKKLKKKIVLTIQDLKDNNNKPNGTKVTFMIPAVFS